MSIEPRLERRRSQVREARVRRRFGVVLWIIVGVALVGAAAWLLQSPWLAIRQIGVYGVEQSNAASILEEAGVRVGEPMVGIHAAAVRKALATDPWIAEARITKTFPNTIEVDIRERTPAAGVAWKSGWMLIAADGVILGPADHVPDGAALLLLAGSEPGAPGTVAGEGLVGGSVAFVAALPPSLRADTVIDIRDGELWARTASVYVRLGSSAEMPQKAAALQALLADGLAEGAVVNLIAPSRPAIEGSSSG